MRTTVKGIAIYGSIFIKVAKKGEVIMSNSSIAELKKLIVSEASPNEDLESSVKSTLEFQTNGLELPSRPFTPEEVKVMRETWTE